MEVKAENLDPILTPKSLHHCNRVLETGLLDANLLNQWQETKTEGCKSSWREVHARRCYSRSWIESLTYTF